MTTGDLVCLMDGITYCLPYVDADFTRTHDGGVWSWHRAVILETRLDLEDATGTYFKIRILTDSGRSGWVWSSWLKQV